MRRLRLYMDERGRLEINQPGFSWLAAISLTVWALQRRLYALALAGFVLSSGISLQLGTTGQAIAFVLQFLAFGAFANRLHRWHLERRGWRITAEELAAAPRAPARSQG
jgi:hypothetical protein